MTDVFISYSRKDIAFARLLHEALVENGLETWIDWQDIPPSADWLAEVYEAIEAADAFVFIISETSLASEICGLEINHANKHNKRLIPIVIKDVEAEKVPRELSVLNWIFFDNAGEKFAEAMEDLVTAITVDQAWVKGHTRFQNRALDWERKERDHGALLRGADLSEAEAWLGGSAGKDPGPTALQTEYILKSREDATRRGRRTLMGVGAALVVAIGLGVLAWTQRNIAVSEGNARATQQSIAEAASTQAIEQSNIAYSRYLGSQSLAKKSDELDLALLLAVEALNMSPSSEALGGLISSLSSREHLETILAKDSQSFVEDIALSPDDKYLAVSYLDRLGYGEYLSTIEVYDLSNNRLDSKIVFLLPEGISSIWGLNFVNENQNLLFCQTDEDEQGWLTSCSLWDLEDNRELESVITNMDDRVEFTDHRSLSNVLKAKEPRSQSSMTVSPDGSYFSISDVNNKISIISLDGMGGSYLDLEGHDSQVTSAAFNSDSSMLATGDSDGMVILWDVSEGIQASERIKDLCGEEDPCSGGVTGLAYSPDGSLLLAAGAGKTVLFDPMNLTVKKRLMGYETQEIRAHFTKEGTPIAFYYFNDSYMIRNAETGLLIGEKINTSYFLGTMQDEILDVNRLNLITASKLTDVRGASVNILNFLRRYPVEAQIHTESGIETVAYHPDTSRLLLAAGGCHIYESGECVQGEVRIWDGETGEQVGEPLIGHTNRIEDIAFSPDGKLLATASADSTIILWDFFSRSPIGDPLVAHQSSVSGIAFSPDGRLLASVGTLSEGSVRLWDLRNEPPTSDLLGSDYVDLDAYDTVVFSPDGKKLVACGEGTQGSRVTVWDVESRSILSNLDTGKENIAADTADFVPDSNILITAGYAGIRIWNDNTLISEPSLGNMDPPNIESIAVSSDGVLIAVLQDTGVQSNNSIAFYDVNTGQQIGDSIQLPSNEFIMMENSRLAFSPDDTQLAVAGDFGVLIWDMRLDSWIEAACEIANRNLTPEEWNTFLIDFPYRETCP